MKRSFKRGNVLEMFIDDDVFKKILILSERDL